MEHLTLRVLTALVLYVEAISRNLIIFLEIPHYVVVLLRHPTFSIARADAPVALCPIPYLRAHRFYQYNAP